MALTGLSRVVRASSVADLLTSDGSETFVTSADLLA